MHPMHHLCMHPHTVVTFGTDVGVVSPWPSVSRLMPHMVVTFGTNVGVVSPGPLVSRLADFSEPMFLGPGGASWLFLWKRIWEDEISYLHGIC